MLGDSYAMGWGVEQGESFPEILEAATGLRVLNAGVPSYGTPRELLMLERLDRFLDLSQRRMKCIKFAGVLQQAAE